MASIADAFLPAHVREAARVAPDVDHHEVGLRRRHAVAGLLDALVTNRRVSRFIAWFLLIALVSVGRPWPWRG